MPDIPFLTTDQMREVDRLMIEDFQIELVQMMENAGRNLAQMARTRFLEGDPRRRSVIVLAGRGGNGGGGWGRFWRRWWRWGRRREMRSEGIRRGRRGGPAGYAGRRLKVDKLIRQSQQAPRNSPAGG
ncbi:MAG TPA: NAD(P)H-hydrate epimerase [Anaerolineales bacterium]|nr:NAD(P)H-hydrate epimerase [Anaerolineales bacterium]